MSKRALQTNHSRACEKLIKHEENARMRECEQERRDCDNKASKKASKNNKKASKNNEDASKKVPKHDGEIMSSSSQTHWRPNFQTGDDSALL